MVSFATACLCIALSIAVFSAGKQLQLLVPHPLVNPPLIAMLLVILALKLCHQPYAVYMQGGAWISWLLGPATVALGIPLARYAKTLLADGIPICGAIFAGAVTSALLAPLVLLICGGSSLLALSIAPKAATTPIAMAIAARAGGIPALAAIFAILGGIIVAVLIEPVLGLLKLSDHRVFGIAAGAAGSGIAAAQAVNRHPQAGAYAAVAISINSIFTAILVPLICSRHWL